MKKLLTLVVLTALLGFNAFAQNSKTTPILGHVNFTPAMETTTHGFNQTRLVDNCDTFTNLFFGTGCDDTIVTYVFDAVNGQTDGFVSGHNSFLASADAEFYNFATTTADTLKGVSFQFSVANHTTNNDKITVTVWNDDGAGGSPGTVLATVTLKNINIVTGGAITTVNLPTPIVNPGTFFVGYQLTYPGGSYNFNKAVATYQSWFPDADHPIHDCDTAHHTAWGNYGATYGNWQPYDSPNLFGAGASLTIYPIICSAPAGGCTITVTPGSGSVCSKKPITLVASGATTYTWAPSTGLNVTTGSTVTAKPKSTTTYTVTGNSGQCSQTVKITVKTTPKVTVSAGSCVSHATLLTASANPSTGEKYQWKLGSTKITGATNSTYSATVAGTYKCVVTLISTSCSVTSKALTVGTCKMDNLTSKSFDVSAYPNPFKNSLSVTIGGVGENVTVTLLDFSGRVVKTYDNVDPASPFEINEDLAQGVYFIKVNAGPNSKMVKVVKE